MYKQQSHLKNWLNEMINFVHLTGPYLPDIWLKVNVGVSVRVFTDEIKTWIGRLSKAESLPQCGWATCRLLRDLNRTKGGREHLLSVSLFLIQEFGLLPLDSDSDWKFCHWLFCFSGLWTETRSIPLALLCLIWTFQPPSLHEPQIPYNKSMYLSISIYTYINI